MKSLSKSAKVIVLMVLEALLLVVAIRSFDAAATRSDQYTFEERVILVDDFAPQPRQGDQFWPYNRLGGNRNRIDIGGSGSVDWGKGLVTATITGGTNTSRGVWTSLNHPIRDCTPLNFSSIFPPQIMSQYQGRITGLRIHVLDGQGTFWVELQKGENTFCPPQVRKWISDSIPLNGGPQVISFDLPPNLGEIGNLNWLVTGEADDFVVVDRVELIATLPQLNTPERAFLWSYAMLLANWDPVSGLTRDRACYRANDFDNVSASGMQAAAAAMAWHQGFISKASATEIVEKTTQALLALPRCHGLWPHFVRDKQINPGVEWSSIDTVIAIVALLEAREALGLETTQVGQVLKDIDWPALILDNGSISMGYVTDCSQRLEFGWRDFGTESWLVNLGYAAATGKVAEFDHTPPTFNGSGFIDELAWLLVPPHCPDRWGTDWCIYRQQAADRQLGYYKNHPCYSGPPRLFGLSAAEVPDLSVVPIIQIYQAFGVGGKIPPNDGTDLLGHAVIVPHYAGLIASLRPTEASTLWEWIETKGLFTPLNNVESFMFIDEPTCEEVVWNALKGSWNLSLQTLGWGRLLAGEGDDNPLYKAVRTNDILRRGYMIMGLPSLSISKSDFPDPVAPGGLLTYTITVSETTGTVDALGVQVTDTVPVNTTCCASIGQGGTLVGNEVISWTNQTVTEGLSIDLTFVVTVNQVPSGTIITNDAYRVVTSTQEVTTGLGSAVTTTVQTRPPGVYLPIIRK